MGLGPEKTALRKTNPEIFIFSFNIARLGIFWHSCEFLREWNMDLDERNQLYLDGWYLWMSRGIFFFWFIKENDKHCLVFSEVLKSSPLL